MEIPTETEALRAYLAEENFGQHRFNFTVDEAIIVFGEGETMSLDRFRFLYMRGVKLGDIEISVLSAGSTTQKPHVRLNIDAETLEQAAIESIRKKLRE